MAYRLRHTNNVERRYKRSGTTYRDDMLKTGWTGLDNYTKAFFDKAVKGMSKKGAEWAERTLADFKANVPVDTGNLRNSLDIQVADNGVSVGVNLAKLIGPKKLRSTKAIAPRLTQKKHNTLVQNLQNRLYANGRTLSAMERFTNARTALDNNPAAYTVGQLRTIPPYNYVPYAERNTRQVGAEGVVLTNFTKTIWRELAKRNAREIFR